MSYEYHDRCQFRWMRNGAEKICDKPSVAYFCFTDGERMAVCKKHLNHLRKQAARHKRLTAPPAA